MSDELTDDDLNTLQGLADDLAVGALPQEDERELARLAIHAVHAIFRLRMQDDTGDLSPEDLRQAAEALLRIGGHAFTVAELEAEVERLRALLAESNRVWGTLRFQPTSIKSTRADTCGHTSTKRPTPPASRLAR